MLALAGIVLVLVCSGQMPGVPQLLSEWTRGRS
jgi:hypothetical protein